MIRKNNLNLEDSLFEASEDNSIALKIYGKKEIYHLTNDIAHLAKLFS